MEADTPTHITAMRGSVSKGVYAAGTKSERQAVFFATSEHRWVLRRKSGPAFGDPELNQYIGHKVVCDGFLVGHTLLAETIKIEDV